MEQKIFKIKGVVQNYAWGGFSYIPDLLGLNNNQHVPFAEYWMGAHSSAPSTVLKNGNEISLQQFIQAHPTETLTQKVVDRFGELPFLFKVLDVNDMLSIQVHPSKEEAEKGFDAEEAAGIPLNAPNRNYKDRNHKPEVMVALSDFWLLHGFKSKENIINTLRNIQEFSSFIAVFNTSGTKGLYKYVMEMEQSQVNLILLPLINRSIEQRNNKIVTKNDPEWWVAKLYDGKNIVGDIDKGIFSIFFFNIVQIAPGQAIFQKAGIPHAYLEGQNIELMANSDNVLRAGLTSKFIDVQELIKHTSFEEVIPEIMDGLPINSFETIFNCPVPDFGISKIVLTPNSLYETNSHSVEILIITEGYTRINDAFHYSRGEAIIILPNTPYRLESTEKCTLFKAFIPLL